MTKANERLRFIVPIFSPSFSDLCAESHSSVFFSGFYLFFFSATLRGCLITPLRSVRCLLRPSSEGRVVFVL